MYDPYSHTLRFEHEFIWSSCTCCFEINLPLLKKKKTIEHEFICRDCPHIILDFISLVI
jgi:hypothetical protein